MAKPPERVQMEEWARMPVSVVRHDLLGVVAEHFAGRRLPIARSIYLAVKELIAEAYGPRAEATRREVANRAGVTLNTLDEYVAELEQLGLLFVERRRAGDLNLPNLWAIAEPMMEGRPPDGVAQQTTPLAQELGSPAAVGHHPSETLLGDGDSGEGDEGVRGRRGKTQQAMLIADWLDVWGREAPAEMVGDAGALLRSSKRVDGRKVSEQEMAKAVAALAEWNRQRGTESGLGANLVSIVMRIRERPSMTAEQHVKLVQSAWRFRWWERNGRARDRPVTPSVIWGSSRCFENVFQDAAAEARGEKSAGGPGRFQKASPVENEN